MKISKKVLKIYKIYKKKIPINSNKTIKMIKSKRMKKIIKSKKINWEKKWMNPVF